MQLFLLYPGEPEFSKKGNKILIKSPDKRLNAGWSNDFFLPISI